MQVNGFDTPKFPPVTITLESQLEVNTLAAIFLHAKIRGIIGEAFGYEAWHKFDRFRTPDYMPIFQKFSELVEPSPEKTRVNTYPYELPPTCRIEEVVERIPKQQTVDTGEFVEVKQRRVVCG